MLESLDDRKKEVLISVLRRYAGMGIQSIITLIDSDLPKRPVDKPFFEEEEIVLLFHDEGGERSAVQDAVLVATDCSYPADRGQIGKRAPNLNAISISKRKMSIS